MSGKWLTIYEFLEIVQVWGLYDICPDDKWSDNTYSYTKPNPNLKPIFNTNPDPYLLKLKTN